MSKLHANALARMAEYLKSELWNESELETLGLYSTDILSGMRNQSLLRADHTLNDAFWSILTLCDPLRYQGDASAFGEIYQDVAATLSRRFDLLPAEAREVAVKVASYLADFRLSLIARPVRATTRSLRDDLLALGAWCWYCGFRFHELTIESFIQGTTQPNSTAPYIDFVTKRGAKGRDNQIEIDHVVPVSGGGTNDLSNLRLACGWCNRYKSALNSIYDAPSRPSLYNHPSNKRYAIPQSYWIVRILGSRRRCEHDSGCVTTIDTNQLFIAPIEECGAMVPGNLGAFCPEHDPIRQLRWVLN